MILLFKLLLRLARCISGTATLEGALVMPLVIALMAGGVEFGRIYSVASTADKSMRSAARYLARVPCDVPTIRAPLACPSSAAICGWGLTNAQKLAVYGSLTAVVGIDKPLIPGWSVGDVTLPPSFDCTALANPTIIHLQATVPFTAIMLSAVRLSNTITMNVRHEERWIGE